MIFSRYYPIVFSKHKCIAYHKNTLDIESFRDRSELPEIDIQECQRKRKGNTQSSSEEERTMKGRITNRNYQMNEEERRRSEENKKKANRNRQEKEKIEADT